MKLRINDKDFTEFTSFDITMSYNAVANSFTFTGLEKMIPGFAKYADCEIFDENDQLLLAGKIISQQQKIAITSNLFSVSGYSKAGILEDCTLPQELYPLQTDNMSLRDITDKILKHYNLEYILTENVYSDFNKPFKKTVIKIDETIKKYLDRLASQRNIVLTNTVHGDLFFTRPIIKDLYPDLELEEGISGFISAQLSINGQRLYEKITVFRQADDNNISTEYSVKNPYAENTKRTLTKILKNGDTGNVEQTAMSELHNQLREIKIKIETTQFVETGRIIVLKSESIGLTKRTELFVEQVKIKGTAKGIQYTLICVPADVYTQKENIKNIFE